jgi:ABC-type uncharacterized transport system involved in gliding motility auxiliary subunit
MRERLYEWADYFGAVALALWVAAGVLFLLKSQTNERLLILVGIGAVFFAIYLFAKFTQVRQAVTGRAARYGSNALIVTIAFIGIVAVINFMGQRYAFRKDLTANQQYTLSPLTVQVLQDLKEPVQAVAFFTQDNGQSKQDVQDRLREYSRITDKLTYKFYDPQADPQIANDYKVQFDGVVVLERGTRRENALQTDEQGLTNAILKVSQDKQSSIYFTTGHGEHGPKETGDNSYSLMNSALETENYKVAVLDLKTLTDTLPSDITALVIAGPRQPFDSAEAKIVKDYLDKNGRVLLLLDPTPLDNPQLKTGLEDLLKDWGINVRNDVVYDPKQGMSGRAQVPVVNSYRSHAVTKDLTGQTTFFPSARSLETLVGSGSSRTPITLFSTSDQSWGETDFASVKSQTAKFDDKVDTKGPLDLADVVEGTGDNPARLIVVGNSTFIADSNLRARGITQSGQQIMFGNGLLFGNMIHWLAGQETLIAIPAKTANSSQIVMTTEQGAFVFWSSFLLIPVAILIIGALVWWRRR